MEPIVSQHLASLARLVYQIEQHNDQYSIGRQLGRALSRVLAQDNSGLGDMGANTGPLSLHVAEGLSRDFAGLLAATGLQLAHDKIASVGRDLNRKHGAAETAGGVGIQG